MKIYPDTTIYIVCPGNTRSGGPESLHQLCSQLIQFGVKAKMIYSFGSNKMNTADPVDEIYKKYHVPWCLPYDLPKIDLAKNILVINESSATSPYVVKKIRLIFWWMSVNNFFEDIMTRLRNHSLNPLAAPVPKFFYFDKADKNIEHWSKSEYSRQFLKVNGISANKIYHVETYMNQIFFKQASKINLAEKENIVVYNPKKGFEVTEKLMAAAPDINWRAIEKMTPAQVQKLLAKTKIYIDFGEHPGRDRLPREATQNFCIGKGG